MPTIDLLPSGTKGDATKNKYMALAEDLGDPDDQMYRVLAHAPGYAEALINAMYEAHFKGSVDHRVKEIIRIQLARLAGDDYSAALRSKKAAKAGLTEELIEKGCNREYDDRFNDGHRWAIDYGYYMYRDPKKVKNKDFYEAGKKHFSEAEIMEIGAHIAISYGMQVFFKSLQLEPVAG